MGGIGGLFSQPDAMAKIMTNPATRAFMQQPDFVAMINVRADIVSLLMWLRR